MAGYTFEGINPTTLNFLSSFVSVLTQSILVIAIGSVYGIVINWYLSRNESRQLPATMFGQVPKNFFGAVTAFLDNVELSLPLIVVVLLFVCADFSNSIADLGLTFVTMDQEGEIAPVLLLTTGTSQIKKGIVPSSLLG